MKKTFIFLLVTGMLVLTGCGSSTNANQQTTGTTAVEGQLDETTKLMAGTMLLETTDYPLDAEQAASLLLLWKGYNTVSSSQTAAEAEVTGLIKQIKDEMTAEQIAAIENMQLTTETLNEKLSALGIEMGGGFMGEMDPEAQATIEALRDSGEMPQIPSGGEIPSNRSIPSGGGQMPSGGNIPSGGGQMLSGGAVVGGDAGTMDLGAMATMQASGGVTGLQQRRTNTMLLNAVIDYLEKMVNP